ncbi:MAG: PEP-CTERM sorting domain-containing protein [Phycisphaerae bacterium]|jgi:hypothetical protein
MKCACLITAIIALAISANAATVYDTEADFLSVIASNYYLEDFDTLVSGETWDAPGANGFDFLAQADGGVAARSEGDPAAPCLSANWVDGTLEIVFTGAPVTALGANFCTKRFMHGTDQMNVITLSDGTVEQFMGLGFRGFTSDVPITSFTHVGVDDPSYAYGWLDHLYVGTMVPEPGAIALLSLGALFLRRR